MRENIKIYTKYTKYAKEMHKTDFLNMEYEKMG